MSDPVVVKESRPFDTPSNKVSVGVLLGSVISLAVEVGTILGFEINNTIQSNVHTILLFLVQYWVADQIIND